MILALFMLSPFIAVGVPFLVTICRIQSNFK